MQWSLKGSNYAFLSVEVRKAHNANSYISTILRIDSDIMSKTITYVIT